MYSLIGPVCKVCAVNSNAINSTGLSRLGAASLADRPSALRSVCLHSGIFV